MRLPDLGPWDAWCARFGIDPNTPDERVLDDYLHGRIPGVWLGSVLFTPSFPTTPLQWRDEAQRELYASWEAYDQARAEMSPLRRRAQDKAETYELERWWTL